MTTVKLADGVEAVEERQGLFDGTHVQAAAHDEDVLIRLMGGIPMPAFLFKGLAQWDPGDDDLAGIDALFDEQVLELGRGDAVDIDLRIDPELMDGKIAVMTPTRGISRRCWRLRSAAAPAGKGWVKTRTSGFFSANTLSIRRLRPQARERLDDESLLLYPCDE